MSYMRQFERNPVAVYVLSKWVNRFALAFMAIYGFTEMNSRAWEEVAVVMILVFVQGTIRLCMRHCSSRESLSSLSVISAVLMMIITFVCFALIAD